MNLKTILAVTQLGLVVLSLVVFAYAVWAMYTDDAATTKNVTGKMVVEAQKMMLYVELAIHLIQLAVGGLVVYRA